MLRPFRREEEHLKGNAVAHNGSDEHQEQHQFGAASVRSSTSTPCDGQAVAATDALC